MATQVKDPFCRGVLAVPQAWRDEAAKRRARWADDPAVPILLSCASEVESEVERLEQEARPYSVTEYADKYHVDAATVRRWIQRGELEATRDEKDDWQIPRTARRVRKPRGSTARGASSTLQKVG